ncbi:TetR/AcrR family transcriptional regulator [soil metagenome]
MTERTQSVQAPQPDPPARRLRGRPRDPQTDGRITQAAAEMLLRHGFDRTTVDGVAARAGVGKATVYRRWPSKKDLAVSAMETLFAQQFPEPDTGSILSDLHQSYRTLLDFVNSETGAAFLEAAIAESIRDPRIAGLYRASMLSREAQTRKSFERAVARGELRADVDLDTAIQWLTGMIIARAVVGRPMPRLDQVRDLVEFTLRGVGTDSLSATLDTWDPAP